MRGGRRRCWRQEGVVYRGLGRSRRRNSTHENPTNLNASLAQLRQRNLTSYLLRDESQSDAQFPLPPAFNGGTNYPDRIIYSRKNFFSPLHERIETNNFDQIKGKAIVFFPG